MQLQDQARSCAQCHLSGLVQAALALSNAEDCPVKLVIDKSVSTLPPLRVEPVHIHRMLMALLSTLTPLDTADGAGEAVAHAAPPPLPVLSAAALPDWCAQVTLAVPAGGMREDVARAVRALHQVHGVLDARNDLRTSCTLKCLRRTAMAVPRVCPPVRRVWPQVRAADWHISTAPTPLLHARSVALAHRGALAAAAAPDGAVTIRIVLRTFRPDEAGRDSPSRSATTKRPSHSSSNTPGAKAQGSIAQSSSGSSVSDSPRGFDDTGSHSSSLWRSERSRPGSPLTRLERQLPTGECAPCLHGVRNSCCFQ
jgi:hypothetical protein